MTEPNDWSDIAVGAENVAGHDPHVSGVSLPLTDLGNAHRVALYLHEDLRWVDDLEIWRAWDGQRWSEAGIGQLLSKVHEIPEHITREAAIATEADAHVRWARDCGFDARLSAMIKHARGLQRLRARSSDFDQERPHLLNTLNCTLELGDGLNWHGHQREDLQTRLCPTPYDPTASSALLDNTLDRFLPDPEERDYVLRCLAVATLGSLNEERKLILMIGPSSTGKSTIMELTMRTLGADYAATANTSIMRGNLDERPRPDMLRALNSWLVTLFEGSSNWELHADQVKRITGGDQLTARALHSNRYVTRPMRATPLIVANEVPHIKGADDAIRRRLLVLLLDASAAGDDLGRIRTALVNDEQTRRAWLALLVRYFLDTGGRYPANMPNRFAEKTIDIFNELDDVAQVLQALVDEGSLIRTDEAISSCVLIAQLWRCYHEWLKKNGSSQMRSDQCRSPVDFGRKLNGLGYETRRSNGSRLVGWKLGSTPVTWSASV